MIDLLIWLAGGAVSVSAHTDTHVHDIEVEDTIVGWVKMKSGAAATIECTTYAPRDEYRIEILGDHQALHLSYVPGRGRRWQLGVKSTRGRSPAKLLRAAERAVPSPAPTRAVVVASVAASRLVGRDGRARHLGHGPFIRHCLDSIAAEAPPPVPPSDALRSLELGLALYRSAASEARVDLPLLSTDALV
jgi:UDP-N-acetyl-2-amino-2-deoxyglucuronate dehydrogenase